MTREELAAHNGFVPWTDENATAVDFWRPTKRKPMNGWVKIFIRIIVAILIFAAVGLMFFSAQ
jgi:hypothetical protein